MQSLPCSRVAPEAVKAVLLQPHAQVGEQVAQHLGLRVVEQLGVPLPVVAPVPAAEVAALLPLAPVKACTCKCSAVRCAVS